MWSKEKKIQEEIDLASSTSVFAIGLYVVGNIEAKSDIRIEGKVKGNITTEKRAVIGKTGIVHGDIKAQDIFVMGEFYGDMCISGLAKFSSSARMIGKIFSYGIAIEEGADMEVSLQKYRKVKSKEKMSSAYNTGKVGFGRKPSIGPLFLEKIKGNIQVMQDNDENEVQ